MTYAQTEASETKAGCWALYAFLMTAIVCDTPEAVTDWLYER